MRSGCAVRLLILCVLPTRLLDWWYIGRSGDLDHFSPADPYRHAMLHKIESTTTNFSDMNGIYFQAAGHGSPPKHANLVFKDSSFVS